MTPNGKLYFLNAYRDDFSQSTDSYQHLFIHQMSHVWQLTRGMSVKFRELVNGLVSYRYILDGCLLNECRMEQQAKTIVDNFILQEFGYAVWRHPENKKYPHVTLCGDISEPTVREGYKIF